MNKDSLCMMIAITFFLTGMMGVLVGGYVLYNGEVTVHGISLSNPD